MRKKFDTVQKRIGLLITSLDLIVVATNFINGLSMTGSVFSTLKILNVWFMFIVVIPFIVSIFVENRYLKILQVFVFILIGSINVFKDYEQFYGPSLFFAGWMLMRHYGFLENRAKLKNVILLVAVVGLSQISANIHTQEGAYAGFMTLWFALFLTILLLIIWRDMTKQQAELKKENISLRTDYIRLTAQLDEIESEKKPYDLKSANISPAEERVIKVLAIYKASNREISERLNIAESTVKLHLYNIFNKIGVDSRFAIIDLCRYNFSDVISPSLEKD